MYEILYIMLRIKVLAYCEDIDPTKIREYESMGIDFPFVWRHKYLHISEIRDIDEVDTETCLISFYDHTYPLLVKADLDTLQDDIENLKLTNHMVYSGKIDVEFEKEQENNETLKENLDEDPDSEEE